MSSILTNTSAMVALQTLRGINSNLAQTQNEISTGKSIGNARDNAAVWAISRTMESDVRGFKAISDSLALGESTVSVARQASETVTELMVQMKGLIVSAQEENVDRSKIQTDIDAIKDQISSVVGAAQFNGLNFVDNTRTETILSSLDRSADGVTANRISVLGQDLTQREQSVGALAARTGQATVTGPGGLDAASDSVAGADITIGGTATAGSTAELNFSSGGKNFNVSVQVNDTEAAAVVAGRLADAITQNEDMAKLGIQATQNGDNIELRLVGQARADGVSFSGSGLEGGITVPAGPTTIAANLETATVGGGSIEAGDSFRVSYGGQNFDFVANERSTRSDVLAGLASEINNSGAFFARVSQNGQNIEITSMGTATVAAGSGSETSGGTAGGGLRDLLGLSVSDFSSLTGGANGNTAFSDLTEAEQRVVIAQSLDRSLQLAESLIQTAINSAASFGSVQARIDTQSDFISKLSDALTTGIGSLVDADMEAASARLQALQVQQQLATQSLSIANQQPQNILALFR
ncbi:MAG: flagellin [Rhodobacteraceae bacterium]|nr:MAG: flagellin [Paracoccaceae bacterium]